MPSLSSYDKGTKGFEGRRYRRDIEATHDALQKLNKATDDYNAKRAEGHRSRYRPRKVLTLGNHEDRISRAVNSNPELDGAIGLDDLKYREAGFEVVPFKSSVVLDGIAYSHYYASGLNGNPISGENIGASLVKKLHMSAVQGHSHLFNHYEHTKPDRQKIFGLSCGCYTHPDFIEGWNRNTEHMWWRGVVIFEGVGHWPGYYEEMRAICQAKILRDYL